VTKEKDPAMQETRGYVQTAFGLVHYYDSGGHSPVIVLLGSAGRSARMFLGLAAELSRHGLRAVSVDLLGSGCSDPIPGHCSMYSVAESVVQLLDGIGIDRASLFGLHTGNKVGSALTAHFGDRIEKFILCGQTHSLIPDRMTRNGAIGDRAKTYSGKRGGDQELLTSWAMLSQRISDIWWRDNGFSIGDVGGAINRSRILVLDEIQSFQDVRRMYDMNFDYDMAADWRQNHVPTLILEIVTPRERELFGEQGPLILGSMPADATWLTMDATGYKHSFEDRAEEIGRYILEFCRNAG
jgi:pimeloyl-ACP methyl ester carboxylesterase